MKHPALQELNRSLFSICDRASCSETLGGTLAKDRCVVLLSPLCIFAALPIIHPIEHPALQELNRSLFSICGRRAGSLRSQLSTQKPALFSTRSLAVYSRRNMILKPSLSFAGPREYRWQGLELPVMMDKRRGTAQITTTSAGSLRSQLSTQKPARFSTRSLAV
jgi:hypothetical protein